MKKVCNHCKKKIDCDGEKYVLLGTYDNNQPFKVKPFSHEAFFHFDCWKEYFGKFKAEAQKLHDITSGSMGGMMGMMGKLVSNTAKIQRKVMKDLDIPEEDIVVEVDPLDEIFVDHDKKRKKGKIVKTPM